MEKFPTLNPFGRAPAASAALLTYEPYYGLREKPFSLSTDPKFLYKSAAHTGTFEDLLLAIRRREGLIVLTGDIGTGKTTLCKAVLERLDRKTFTTFVPDPFLSREDLLKMLAARDVATTVAASVAPPAAAMTAGPVMWGPAPATPRATPAAAPVAQAPPPALVPPVASAIGAPSNDLSGVEVRSIDHSPDAPPMFSSPEYYHSIFANYRPRRQWRLARWAAAIVVLLAIVFFAMRGEALIIHYFSTVDGQGLPAVAAPASLRLPPPILPVPIPADVTLPSGPQ